MKGLCRDYCQSGNGPQIADAMTVLPGVEMADACWGGGDVYAVVEVPAWPNLSALVLDKVYSMPRRNPY